MPLFNPPDGVGPTGSISAGGTSASLGQVVFSNSNNVTFGMNGATVTGSASFGQSVQTQNLVSVQGSIGAISFANSNGITFGGNASTLTASHNGLTSQSNQAFSASGGSSAFQTLNFANSNGITFSNSAGSVVASHNGLTSQSNQALSGSNGSLAFQTATFGNLNGLSFYTSNGSMVGSYTVPTQSNQQIGLYAVSNTTQNSSGLQDARSLSFNGAGIASVGVTNGSVVISVPSGGGGGDGYNIIAAGTQTANSAATIVFSNSNGVSFGLDGSTVTASVNAAGGNTLYSSILGNVFDGNTTQVSIGQSSVYFTPFSLPVAISGQRLHVPVIITASSSAVSSGQVSHLMEVGLYSRAATNSTVLTQFFSKSYSLSGSYSSNASMQFGFITGVANSTSYQSASSSSAGLNVSSLIQGTRNLMLPLETVLPVGEYWVAQRHQSSQIAGTAGNMLRVNCYGNVMIIPGAMGVAINSSNSGMLRDMGLGLYSAQTAALPTAVSLTQIRAAASKFPVLWVNTTV